MESREYSILNDGLAALRSRLPATWSAEIEVDKPVETDFDRAGLRADAVVRIAAPDRRSALVLVEIKRQLEPRGVLQLASQLRSMTEAGAQLVIAPYMSPAVRERLQEAGLAYLDLTGNARLELQKPGLFIETQGARSNPDRSERPARSLRGTKAGKIVRALLEAMDPPGVRDLADRLRIDPGYISRVFALLDSEALIERRGRGRITRVDWERLLRRWAEEAPLDSRGEQATYLEPRGVQSLLSKLGSFEPRYAITGTLAASQFAPIAPPRLATVYVEGAAAASEKLGLRAAESGANVLLIEPNDDTVFENTTQKGPLTIVAVAQAAVDLLTSPGRGPAEAEELIAWMAKNERAWRR